MQVAAQWKMGSRPIDSVLLPILIGSILGLCGCSNDPLSTKIVNDDSKLGPTFYEDVTQSVGLDFVHDPGRLGAYFMPQSMGSGCALFDFNGDGKLDIYLLHHGGVKGKKNQLFQQKSNGAFQDVSKGSGLDVAGHNCGVAIGDVDNDGKPDVVVTQYGGIKLFRSLGNGAFKEVSEQAGLVNPLWGTSAAFLDFDRDGWLDLVVVNYVAYDASQLCHSPQGHRDFCGPSRFRGSATKLFRNLGPQKTNDSKTASEIRFKDVSFDSGVGRVAGPGLGVACADFDGDGWQDIFVANDGAPNRLWINKRDGTFANQAPSRGIAYNTMGTAYAGMGVAIGDVDRNGMLDLCVSHLNTETHTLWRQGPKGQFRDVTVRSGLMGVRRSTGFGTLMTDFELDGNLDLVIVNGNVFRGGPAKNTDLGFWETYADKNQLFANDGSGKFRDVSSSNPPFCGHWNVARGVACGDVDNDGAADLLVTTLGGRARLFRNAAPKRGNWLTVRAVDPKLNREAYGAEVRVRAGKTELLRVVSPAESYLSSSSPLAHFGLGKNARYDSIQVNWPDGSVEMFAGGKANRLIEIRKSEGNSS